MLIFVPFRSADFCSKQMLNLTLTLASVFTQCSITINNHPHSYGNSEYIVQIFSVTLSISYQWQQQ